jgi:hypothetical protein
MNPPGKSHDIYLFIKRQQARERAVYRTQAQLRRLRVFPLPAGGASTPAASDGLQQPWSASIAALPQADAVSPTRRGISSLVTNQFSLPKRTREELKNE